MAPPFVVDHTLAGVVRPAVVWWCDATVPDRPGVLDDEISCVIDRVSAAPPADTQAVREMYKRIGLDPTKTRPSNEALLRRVRRGDAFPRVNGLVDAINVTSLEVQLPYGVYDRAALAGTPVLRLGRSGESYGGIRKDTVHVGGRVTVADDLGPFGNPTSDSARAMVTDATTAALVIVYAPAATTVARLSEVVDLTEARLMRAVGGREERRWIA